MSSPLLMIPGPTEFDPNVLKAMSHKGTSHVDPAFISVFSDVIKQTREVFLAPDGQPIILTGSGSLGWDVIGFNLLAAGDLVLVVNTGYFGDRWKESLEMRGARVETLGVQTPGDCPTVEQVVERVKQLKDSIKMITFTHVDTSTGVRVNLKDYAPAVRAVVPDILIGVDGVCAAAAEELRMTDWDIDAYLTGTQKAIGVPVGLSLTVFRPRAMERFKQLSEASAIGKNYYVDLRRWLPVMQAYEEKRPSYYATPAVSLIFALNVGFKIILADGGIEKRFEQHRVVAEEFRNTLRKLGFEFVPLQEEFAANTMSAIKYPAFKSGSGPADFLTLAKNSGAIFAGGLHAQIKDLYFRVGHMGLSSRTPAHIYQTVRAIQQATLATAANPPTQDAEVIIRSRL